MADLSRTIEIIFEGVDRLGSGVDSVTRQLDAVNNSAQGVVNPIADATTEILKFEAALIAGGVAATGLAVKLAGDFDAQFREISTLIDAPTEDLDEFRRAVVAYGSDSTLSLDQVNQAVYNAISAGVDYKDSLEAVSTAEQLSIAGKADLDETLTVLVSSLNAYGKGMDEAETFSDLLFTTVKNGQTTLPELGSSLSSVTGLAATVGVSFEELLAGVSTLTATGSSTSEAITQIRAALTALINPSKQASDIAAELGIEFNAAALESNGFKSVIDDVAEATGGNTEQMAKLFGSVEALNGVLTLTGLGAESFADNIDAMGESAGATEAAYDKMAGTLEQGNQKIVNAFTGSLIAFGDPLLDEFGGIQEAIAEIFNAIGASVSDGQLQEFVGLVEGVMGSLEDALQDVATNLPDALETADFEGYVNGFEAVRDAISDLFDNADITTAEGLVSVIETLGAGVELLGEFTAGTIEQIGPFIEQLADLAKWVSEVDPAMAKFIGTWGGLSVALAPVLSVFGIFINTLALLAGSSGAIPTATRAIGSMSARLLKIAGPAGAVYFAYNAFEDLRSKIQEFNEQPINLADKVQRDLADIENIEGDEFSIFNVENLLAGYQSLSEYFGWGEEAAQDFEVLGQAGEAAALKITEVSSSIGKSADDGFGKLTKAAIDAALEVANSSDSIGGESADNVEKISAAAIKAATDIVGAADNISEGLGRFDAPILEQLGELPDELSRVANILENDTNGVTASAEKVGKALNDIRQALDDGEINTAEYESLKKALLDVRDSGDSVVNTQKILSGELLESEEAVLKSQKAFLDYQESLAEIASDERLKKIELDFDLKTTKVEEETKRIKAAFSSIDSTVESTGETLSSLTGVLGTFNSRFSSGYRNVLEIVQNEEKRRDKALELQADLTKAQTESLNARTKALQNGDGLIKIESDGLEPALEMIMWNVLEKVQMRANADGAEFLIGIN